MRISLFLIFLIFASSSLAESSFAQGAPLEDFWQEDLKPTLANSLDRGGQTVLASGLVATMLAFQYDNQIVRYNDDVSKRWMDNPSADFWGWIGNGSFGIAIALTQMYFDSSNGIQHAKAISLTAASHITLALITHRERPYKQDHLSFPSGHASSAFATATSLAYSYGYKVGIPALAVASIISFSRVNQNIHHLSDTMAGATLGVFWAHASARNTKRTPYHWMPFYDGQRTGIQMTMEF